MSDSPPEIPEEEEEDDAPFGSYEDQLVFTLGAAAVPWIFLGIFALCVSVGLFLLTTPGWAEHMEAPLESAWWALIPLPVMAFAFWRARKLLRQPYIELDAERIRAPSQDADVPWLTLVSFEEQGDMLHLKRADGGEVQIDLRPITPSRRDLVRRAIRGRLER